MPLSPTERSPNPLEVQPHDYAHKKEAKLRCKPGFRMKGCSDVQCTNGEWTCRKTPNNEGLSFPECIPKQEKELCPPLPEFVHGGVWRLNSYHQLDQFAPGDVAILKCTDPAFRADTFPEVRVGCVLEEDTGKKPHWTVTQLPKCVPMVCPPLIPAALPSGIIMEKGSRTNWNYYPAYSSQSGRSTAVNSRYLFKCVKTPTVEAGSKYHMNVSAPPEPEIERKKSKEDESLLSYLLDELPELSRYNYEETRAQRPKLNNTEEGNEIQMPGETPKQKRLSKFDGWLSGELYPDDSEYGTYERPSREDVPGFLEDLDNNLRGLKWMAGIQRPAVHGRFQSPTNLGVARWIRSHTSRSNPGLFCLQRKQPQPGGIPDESLHPMPDLSVFKNCSHVAYNESRLNEPHSTLWDGISTLCPPLPWFNDLTIPGWKENTGKYVSNSIPLYFSATLDCGDSHWPQPDSTDPSYTKPPTAKCVPFIPSDSKHESDSDSESNENKVDGPSSSTNVISRRRVIGRWVFYHGSDADGSGTAKEWHRATPPTCVPRLTCGGLPTYSGWRLASGLAPHQFYAHDTATCTTFDEDTKERVTRNITCALSATSSTSDSSIIADAHIEPRLSPSDLLCKEVTCPVPGSYRNAFRAAQWHMNFRGYIDPRTLLEEDVQLDYFAEGDQLFYRCYRGGVGFRLQCHSDGQWIQKGDPCPDRTSRHHTRLIAESVETFGRP